MRVIVETRAAVATRARWYQPTLRRVAGALTVYAVLSAVGATPVVTAQNARPAAGAISPVGHLGVPEGWLAQYPCRPRLRPAVVDAPRGALTSAEACAAAVAVYEAWTAAARSSTRPFTPAALADTGRIDAVGIFYPWDVRTRRTDYTVELHFGPGAVPVVGVVDARVGVRRVYPGEPFLSRAAYNRALRRRSR